MLTQITPGKSFEVHPYRANDANKASDKEESVFFFHVSHQTRTSFPLLGTAEDGFWLQTAARFTLKIRFLYHERKARARKGGKRIVWSQKQISKAPPKTARKI